MPAKKSAPTDTMLKELRTFGLAYPGAHTKSPWPGHLDLAVKDKTFAYLSLEGEPLHVSCKLPRSSEVALMLPFVKPAGYGLGKSGWVAASFEHDEPDVAMLKAWIDESYRAQAPKKLVASLGAPVTGDAAPAGEARPAKRTASARTTAEKPAKRAAPARTTAKQPAKLATGRRSPKR